MSKRRRNPWDEDTFDFKVSPPPNVELNTGEPETPGKEVEFLDEAHEALSKLFNKTNKRAKQLRGVRRKDAWQ